MVNLYAITQTYIDIGYINVFLLFSSRFLPAFFVRNRYCSIRGTPHNTINYPFPGIPLLIPFLESSIRHAIGFKELGYRDALVYTLLRILLPKGLNVFTIFAITQN